MDRRQFIKATALTGTSATLASCGNPEYHLIRFIPEEVLTPGIAVLKPSVCPLCSAGCGLSVRVMEGEAEVIRKNQLGVTKMGLAKKLDGDPANPVNQGDRKSTRLNSSHSQISYAVFCLKKKKNTKPRLVPIH